VAIQGAALLSLFKRHRFLVEIILLCVRWYCKYAISYRDLAEMMQERSVNVDPSTIFRWVQRYAPEIDKRIRRDQGRRSGSWHVDETYVRVGGQWKYLFRAVDKHGQLIAFMLSDRRDIGAAYHILRKALKTMSNCPPSSIKTDKLPSYPKAIWRLQKESRLSKNVEHRTSKYLNNIVDPGHGSLKRMTRRGHCVLPHTEVTSKIRPANQLFGLAARATRSAGFDAPFPS